MTSEEGDLGGGGFRSGRSEKVQSVGGWRKRTKEEEVPGGVEGGLRSRWISKEI